MNFTISVQEFMDIVAKHLVLSKMNMEVEKDFRRFNTFSLYGHLIILAPP